MSRYVILLPPPCTNANLHMGHLAGVYIPGDVYARYLKVQGHEVIMIGGADQNNTYTKAKADKMDISFESAKQYFSQQIQQSLNRANIKMDIFQHTDAAHHRHTVKNMVTLLKENGMLSLESVPQFYCSYCETSICDTEVSGMCSRCGAQSEAGICENCNAFIFNRFLFDAKHKVCERSVIHQDQNALVLNLDKVKSSLINKIQHSDWDNRLKYKTLDYLARGKSEPIIITNGFDGGITVDEPELDADRLAIWFEAIWICFSGLTQHFNCSLPELIQKLNEDSYQLIPFMGQDTEFCYSVALSSVLLGLGYDDIFDRMSIQKFIKLNGAKFSSSRNHLIYLEELTQHYSVDIIRLYALSTIHSYCEDKNDFIINDLNQLHTLFIQFEKHLAHVLGQHPPGSEQPPNTDFATPYVASYHEAMQNVNFREAYLNIIRMVEILSACYTKGELRASLMVFIPIIKPVMPFFAECLDQKYLKAQD